MVTTFKTTNGQGSYVKTISGILKVIEIFLSVLTFVFCVAGACGHTSKAGWAAFVSFIAFIIVTCLMVFNILGAMQENEKFPLCFIEFLFYSIWSVFYLIAASVLASMAWHHHITIFGEIYNCPMTAGTASFFAFSATAFFVLDAVLKFREWYRFRRKVIIRAPALDTNA